MSKLLAAIAAALAVLALLVGFSAQTAATTKTYIQFGGGTPAPTATPTANAYALTGPPTIAPAPTTDITTTYQVADAAADGLDIDSTIWFGGASGTTNGFNTQLQYLCNNWFGAFRCFRHFRDGHIDNQFTNQVADLNYLATQYGMDNALEVDPYDTGANLTTDIAQWAQVKTIYPNNEPDNMYYYALLSTSSAVNATSLSINAPQINFPPLGASVTIGEGPTQDATTITGYSISGLGGTGTATVPALAHAHTGNIDTVLTVSTLGATPVPIPVPSPTGSLALWPPAPTPTPFVTSAPSITVNYRNGIAPSDYLTINCLSPNIGSGQHGLPGEMEVVQVASGYTASTGAGVISLVAAPRYAHTAGQENVVEGCIQLAPSNFWGALSSQVPEMTRIKGAFPSGTVALPATAGQVGSANAWNPQYGGTRFAYSAFDVSQVHGACYFNCGGPFGDGTVGTGGSLPWCFTSSCNYGSWQYNISGGLVEGGTIKPVYCSECGWAIVPIGAPATSSPTNYGSSQQDPENIAAVYAGRDPLWMLNHGYSRFYFFELLQDASVGPLFCTEGLVFTSDCNGATYGVASGTKPSAAYKSYTDLIGLMTDPGCKYPGCTFTPNSITWSFAALPSHTGSGFDGTDPHQIQLYPYEYASGNVVFLYFNEGTDYFSPTGPANWCSNAANTGTNASAYTCFSATLHVVNGHNWTCTNIDTDDLSTDATFGNLQIASSHTNFNGSDLITLSVKPELQALYCYGTGFSPSTSGTPVPNPTPVPGQISTPDPTPTWATATAVPNIGQL